MDRRTAVLAAQLRQMLATSNTAIVSSVLLASILAYFQLEVIAPRIVFTWLAVVVLVAALRAVLAYSYRRSPAPEQALQARLRNFSMGVTVAGITWGAAGILMFPPHDLQHQMFLIFMLAGLSAGASISYAADLPGGIVFSIAALTPLIVRLFTAEQELSAAMGMATTLYLGFILMNVRQMNWSIRENITLHLEATEREEAIKISEERYRLLLSHSPAGIFHYDTNLVITYCNDRFAAIMRNTPERLVGLDMKSLKDQSVLPALRKALEGETGYYEGHYTATLSDTAGWFAITCATSRDASGQIAGGVAIVQDITERNLAEAKIRSLAFYDSLTQLPNRRLLYDRLDRTLASSKRSGRYDAVLLLDLDNFKPLNDTYGHDVGDLLLIEAAHRIGNCVREIDTAARLGGDEFVVALSELASDREESARRAAIVGEKIRTALAEPYLLPVTSGEEVKTIEHRCTASIGVVVFGSDARREDILKHADVAMYQAKAAGRNRVSFSAPDA